MRKSKQTYIENILQNTYPLLSKAVKVMETKERLRECHRSEETRIRANLGNVMYWIVSHKNKIALTEK